VTLSDPGSSHASQIPEPATAPGPSRASDAGFTVAIIDDQPVTRAGMEKVISDDPSLTVAASVAGVNELHTGSEPHTRYDAAILALPARIDALAISTIATVTTFTRTVVTSTWERPAMVLDAVRSGARGCVTRHSDREVVLTALRVVSAGGFYVCEQLVDRFYAELRRSPREEAGALAPREIETVRWIALGFTHSQIATRMGLSQATVNTYAKRIRSKLKVSNKAELTRMAIELGYLDDDRHHVAA
jgi:DNA-binding NarL/FixJ family response regulator